MSVLIAGRLEELRTRLLPQGLSLREFWKRLIEDGDYTISYQSVQNYHSLKGRRDQPSSYLVRVAQVFQVNAAWLLTGVGSPYFEGEGQVFAFLGPEDTYLQALRTAWHDELMKAGVSSLTLPTSVWASFEQLAWELATAARPGLRPEEWTAEDLRDHTRHLMDGVTDLAARVVLHGHPVLVRVPHGDLRVALLLLFEGMRLLIGAPAAALSGEREESSG